MGQLLPDCTTEKNCGALIDRISNVRTVGIPFAAPKQLYRITESELVKDLLHALQGSPGHSILWNRSKQRFFLNLNSHVSHLSPSSLVRLIQPFLSAATSLRKVQSFIFKASKSLIGKSPARKYPTLEAFANAVSMRLKYIREAALDKELEAVRDPASVSLLNVFESLSWVCAAAKFLDHVVKNAVPDRFSTYDAANLSARILSFLFETLNNWSLLKDGGEEAYRTVLLLFVGSLWPHAQLLDTWLQEGSLVDPFGELFFYANSSATIRDTAFWQSGYYVRYQTEEAKALACPSFILPIAKSVLSSGKSLQLLRHVQKESERGTTVKQSDLQDVSKAPPLFDQFCISLKKLLSQGDDTASLNFDLCESLLGSKTSSARTLSATPCQVACDSSLKESLEDVLTASNLPSLDDNELRKAVFADHCDPNDSSSGHSDESSEFTSYILGDGCGRILQCQMVVDETAMKKLFACPTDLPSLQDERALSDKRPDQRTMLEWLERVDFQVTPSSTIIVQECLLSFMTKQVNAVGTELLKMLMGEWRLMEELRLLRALYLMGSGDLLQQFSFVLFNKLDRAEPWDDFYELNTMLQESVRSSADAALYYTPDSLVVKMESRGANAERAPVHHHPLHFTGRSPIFGIDILEDLRFEYKVAWPLELIIDAEAIRRYNQVMCFLLKVKRAKQALDKACRWMWKGDSSGHKPQLLLQMKLMHFVNTLHHYVMDQVLYSSWLELCEGMSCARSLDQVISCHDIYLISIQRQCFVAPDKLWTLISSRVKTILGLALDFFSVQRSLYGGGSAAATATAPKCQLEIENVTKQFDECIAFLLRVLSFKLNVGHFPHLTELITRINYNNYYISESGQLLTPIPDLHHHGVRSRSLPPSAAQV